MSDDKVLPFRPRHRRAKPIRELTAPRAPAPVWAPTVTIDVGLLGQAIKEAVTLNPPKAPETTPPKKP